MNPKDVFSEAIKTASSCVQRVLPSDLQNASPCSEWPLIELLNHLVYEILWIPDLLMGKTISEVGNKYEGNVLGSNLHATWNKSTKIALESVKNADLNTTIHLSYGDKSANSYIMEIAGDVLIHGWDVGRSLQSSVLFNSSTAQAIYDSILPRIDEYKASGLFGKPISVGINATIQDKLLGLVGRNSALLP